MDIISWLDALQTLLVPILAVIGITGGLKGFFGKAPDWHLGNLVIPGGLWLSWVVALGVRLFEYATGHIVIPPNTDIALFLAAQWAALATAANVIRNWIMPSGTTIDIE